MPADITSHVNAPLSGRLTRVRVDITMCIPISLGPHGPTTNDERLQRDAPDAPRRQRASGYAQRGTVSTGALLRNAWARAGPSGVRVLFDGCKCTGRPPTLLTGARRGHGCVLTEARGWDTPVCSVAERSGLDYPTSAQCYGTERQQRLCAINPLSFPRSGHVDTVWRLN